jgi:hypothetical protein
MIIDPVFKEALLFLRDIIFPAFTIGIICGLVYAIIMYVLLMKENIDETISK